MAFTSALKGGALAKTIGRRNPTLSSSSDELVLAAILSEPGRLDLSR
ncbi:hypothetical protein [Streptomyces colonosanans]|nr:hypothetical protein [Streptomyces colonosanans]